MINKISNFFLFFILILPATLITGPAIPDITITLSIIFYFTIYFLKEKKEITTNNLFLISIFFWVYLVFISFFAENSYLSFKDALIFIRILLIPILIFLLIKKNEKLLFNFILVIFLTVIFVAIDTLYQFSQYNAEIGFGPDLLGFYSNWYGRLTGPFKDELIPGAYLSKFTLIGLIYIFINFKNNITQNFLAIFYLVFVGVTIFITGERMAIATYLMANGILFLFYNTKRAVFLSSIILIIIISFIITKIHPFYNDFNIISSTPYHQGLQIEKSYICNEDLVEKNLGNKNCKKIINLQPEVSQILQNFSVSAYGEIYRLSIMIFKDHLYAGAGLNNFTYLCKNDERYKKQIKNYDCPSHPHNIYIQFLVETGIFGFLFFIFYLLCIFSFIFKNNFNKYSLIGISSLVILFWPIMSTGSLLKNWNGISTFFIIGLSLAVSKLYKKSN